MCYCFCSVEMSEWAFILPRILGSDAVEEGLFLVGSRFYDGIDCRAGGYHKQETG